MSAELRFTLDTNILIYAAVRDSSARHRVANDLLTRAAGKDCLLSLQALCEFYAVTTRKRLLSADRARSLIEVWLALFETQPASRQALALATDAVATHRLSFWDALLWATAREAGCRWLLSEDFQDRRELGGVRFVDPFADRALPRDLERALGGPG